jgi:hypothetical protein
LIPHIKLSIPKVPGFASATLHANPEMKKQLLLLAGDGIIFLERAISCQLPDAG